MKTANKPNTFLAPLHYDKLLFHSNRFCHHHLHSTRLNEKFEPDLVIQLENSSALKSGLEDQRLRAASIEHEFSACKKEHKLSGDLGTLQAAVADLQAQLQDRDTEVKA